MQECVQYNYPNNFKFTRSVEIKHVTRQKSNYTVISKEFPTNKGDPYYPIMDKKNEKNYKKYEDLINNISKKNIYFEGRLAKYKYFNTDEVIENALILFNKLKNKYKNIKPNYLILLMEKKILVVYVFSKFDEIDRLINFVEFYKKYESGIPHKLLICFKLLDKITLNKCRNILKSIIIMNILMKKKLMTMNLRQWRGPLKFILII